MSEREESDQLPEEAPGDQVPDDDGAGSGSARDRAKDSPGAADDDSADTATGQEDD